MGNSNSATITQPAHNPWPHSLPRENLKNKKLAGLEAKKVLPERVPGQRLKTTANGWHLQTQGTISPRKVGDVHCPPPDYPCSENFDEIVECLKPRSGPSPCPSHCSLPIQQRSSQITVFQSPAKDRIKSRKRNKAPLPPPGLVQVSTSLPLDRLEYSPQNVSLDASSVTSSYIRNSKLIRGGLFKKKAESRMLSYEGEPEPHFKELSEAAKERQPYTNSTPFSKYSNKNEIKEKTKSLDNIQHDLRNSSSGLGSSLHNLDDLSEHDQLDSGNDFSNRKVKRQESYLNDVIRKIVSTPKNELNPKPPRAPLVDKSNQKITKSTEVILHKRYTPSKSMEGLISSPVGDPRRFQNLPDAPTFEYHRAASPCSSECSGDSTSDDEWELAEKELLEKKREAERFQNDIKSAAENLRKTAENSEKTEERNVEKLLKSSEKCPSVEKFPKSFFFGMEPEPKPSKNRPELDKEPKKTKSKLKLETLFDQSDLLRPTRTEISAKIKSKNVAKTKTEAHPKKENRKKILDEIDKFASSVEKERLVLLRNEERESSLRNDEREASSLTKKKDAGYHSRHNSGSLHLDTDPSDEENTIRMNLRPILPRRQLELPRFSPNAAWKLLSVETDKPKDEYIPSSASDDMSSFRDYQLYRHTRAVVPTRSVEKSADSGISGDAGSPGPLQEFDTLGHDKRLSPGPLAVSSPMATARMDGKRMWTPEQDLDENSFEENAAGNNLKTSGISSGIPKIPTVPKLTCRTSMFNNAFAINAPLVYQKSSFDCLNSISIDSEGLDGESEKEHQERRYENVLESKCREVNWRENFSMTRSIPNSLDKFDEPDRPKFSKISPKQSLDKKEMKSSSPKSLSLGNKGHIMYLPEYKTYNLDQSKESKKESSTSKSDVKNNLSGTKNNVAEVDYENEILREEKNKLKFEENNDKNNSKMVVNKKAKSKFEIAKKKFAFKSTLRMMEKKMIQEKIAREVEEEERMRKQEAENMLRVEEEFQRKREIEKRRLKNQLNQLNQQNRTHEEPEIKSVNKAVQSNAQSNIKSCDISENLAKNVSSSNKSNQTNAQSNVKCINSNINHQSNYKSSSQSNNKFSDQSNNKSNDQSKNKFSNAKANFEIIQSREEEEVDFVIPKIQSKELNLSKFENEVNPTVAKKEHVSTAPIKSSNGVKAQNENSKSKENKPQNEKYSPQKEYRPQKSEYKPQKEYRPQREQYRPSYELENYPSYSNLDSFQSLPTEIPNSSSEYDTSIRNTSDYESSINKRISDTENSRSKFNVGKVAGRRKDRTRLGYHSDSTDCDTGPHPSDFQRRKSDLRSEVVEASKYRNAATFSDPESYHVESLTRKASNRLRSPNELSDPRFGPPNPLRVSRFGSPDLLRDPTNFRSPKHRKPPIFMLSSNHTRDSANFMSPNRMRDPNNFRSPNHIRDSANFSNQSQNRLGDSTTFSDSESYRNGRFSPSSSDISKFSQTKSSTASSFVFTPANRLGPKDCRRTQELCETKAQDLPQYKEYRSSERGFISSLMGYMRPNYRGKSVSENYRRDFCLGNIPPTSPPLHNEERLQKARASRLRGRNSFSQSDAFLNDAHSQRFAPFASPPLRLKNKLDHFSNEPGVYPQVPQNGPAFENDRSKSFLNRKYKRVPFVPQSSKILSVT